MDHCRVAEMEPKFAMHSKTIFIQLLELYIGKIVQFIMLDSQCRLCSTIIDYGTKYCWC